MTFTYKVFKDNCNRNANSDVTIGGKEHEALYKIGSHPSNDKICMARHHGAGYVCTRDLGHVGSHIACGGYVCAIWPQTDEDRANAAETIAKITAEENEAFWAELLK